MELYRNPLRLPYTNLKNGTEERICYLHFKQHHKIQISGNHYKMKKKKNENSNLNCIYKHTHTYTHTQPSSKEADSSFLRVHG